ncbi:hypothetical protein ACFVFQ_38620 [Streptomyces sp. NPDC057743]|uniref:hypothetical protein n=1 Tax=Streptomyces sp. NPDC057743 TaxID=3346236 RepID=UPI00367F45B8
MDGNEVASTPDTSPKGRLRDRPSVRGRQRFRFRWMAGRGAAVVLVGAAGLDALITGAPAMAQDKDDTKFSLYANGVGSGSYADPSKIPDDGLTYSVPLPFYQENGIYIEDAGIPLHVEGGARELTLDHSKSNESRQEIPQSRGGEGLNREILKSILGTVVNVTANALKNKDPDISKDASALQLLGFNENAASSVTMTERVSFSVSDKLKIIPRQGVAIEARPVFYKVKTVSDEWRKAKGETRPRLMAANKVSDVVVKMGWLLQCDNGKGGQRVCEQGKDYRPDTSVNPERAELSVVKSRVLPRTGVPDATSGRSGEIGHRKGQFRWTGTAPINCELSATGVHEPDTGIFESPKYFPEFSTKCPPVKSQRNPGFTEYRIKYSVEGHKSGIFDFSWTNRTQGTLSESKWWPGMVRRNSSDTEKMARQAGIDADGETKHYRLESDTVLCDFCSIPKMKLEIIPVK